jgi:hypothetical protein
MREIRAKITSRGGTLTLDGRGVRFGAASRRGVGGVVVVSRRAGKGREGKVGGRRYRGSRARSGQLFIEARKASGSSSQPASR